MTVHAERLRGHWRTATKVATVRGAVFFDVDGTLVPNTSSSQHLAGFLGHLTDLATAEDAYTAGRLDNREVSVLDAAGWTGRPSSDIAGFLEHLPLVDGTRRSLRGAASTNSRPTSPRWLGGPSVTTCANASGSTVLVAQRSTSVTGVTREPWLNTSTSSASATSL
jgi:hypothetical protein